MYTVGENIITAIKMRKYFWYSFSSAPHLVYRSSIFAIAKVVALNDFALTFETDNFRMRAIKKEAKN